MTGEIDRLIDRDRINLLFAIVETRSFTSAAELLGVSQPAISQQVRRLEKVAGRKLFRRGRLGVELTHDGEAVVIYAKAMLALTADLRRQFELADTEAKISIGMSEDFCRTALPAVLGIYAQEHPRVDMRIISGSYAVLTEAIEAKAVDFAVMRRYSRYPDATLVWTDQLVWFGRPDQFPTVIEDPVPLVMPMAPNPAREPPIEALRSERRSWRVKFESPSIAGIEAAMQAGIGFCVGPRSLRLYDIVELPANSGLPALPTVDFVMVGPEPGASDVVQTFSKMLREVAAPSFHRSMSVGL